eukprot:1162035-Pelagomonas_calceolata.AAC.12
MHACIHAQNQAYTPGSTSASVFTLVEGQPLVVTAIKLGSGMRKDKGWSTANMLTIPTGTPGAGLLALDCIEMPCIAHMRTRDGAPLAC